MEEHYYRYSAVPGRSHCHEFRVESDYLSVTNVPVITCNVDLIQFYFPFY